VLLSTGTLCKRTTALCRLEFGHIVFLKARFPAGADKSFGSLDEMKAKFNAAAAARFGSGWAWLGLKSGGDLTITTTANQDNPLQARHRPARIVRGHPTAQAIYFCTAGMPLHPFEVGVAVARPRQHGPVDCGHAGFVGLHGRACRAFTVYKTKLRCISLNGKTYAYQWLSTHVGHGVQQQAAVLCKIQPLSELCPSLCAAPVLVQVGIVEENHTPILGLDVWEHVRPVPLIC